MPGLLPDGYSRIIGEPRLYKGFAKIFNCQADGARELMFQKRDGPEFFKALRAHLSRLALGVVRNRINRAEWVKPPAV